MYNNMHMVLLWYILKYNHTFTLTNYKDVIFFQFPCIF